jgi:small ligand-binding sensory domain FIST
MLRAGAGLSVAPDPVRAVREASEAALAQAGAARADAAFLFASGHDREAGRLAAAGVDVLGTGVLAGAAGHGVLAGAVEEEDRPAIAVLALAGVEAAPFLFAELAGTEDGVGGELEAVLGRSAVEGDLVVLLADPLSLDVARLLAAFDDALPYGSLVGAAAAVRPGGGAAPTWAGREACVGGACGVVLSLACPPRTQLCQGCRPITEPLAVTRCEGHWVLEIDGRPALDVYREVSGALLAADLRRAAERVLVALPRVGSGGADEFVTRTVAGFAPERGAFAVAEELRPGARLRLALRDADLAREDLARALAAAGPPPAASLYLSCPARGQSLFRHAGLEAAYVARALEPSPVAGLFGSFQFGPVAGGSERLTHAGVLALLA